MRLKFLFKDACILFDIDFVKFLFYLVCFILLFSYIYAPPFQFLPFGIDKLIVICSYLYLSIKGLWVEMFNKFKKEYCFFLFIFIYSLFRCLHSGDYTYLSYDFLLLIEVIPCSFFIYILVGKYFGFRLDWMMINCSIVASFISVYLIINPTIAFYLKTELLKYPEDLIGRFLFRGYGLSDGLLFSYPVVQGFCAGFLILGIFRKQYYLVYLFPLFISIFVNARSGLVPLFISIIMVLFLNFRSFVKKALLILFLLLVSFSIIVPFFSNNEMLQVAFNWGMTTFDIIGDLFKGNKTENVDVLLGDMIVFPKSILEWVFGSGEFIFGKLHGTDIGYLLRLNFGGLLYSILYLLLFILMFLRLVDIKKYLAYFLFLFVVYGNFKADFFIINTCSRFFFFVYVVSILDDKMFNISFENRNSLL